MIASFTFAVGMKRPQLSGINSDVGQLFRRLGIKVGAARSFPVAGFNL